MKQDKSCIQQVFGCLLKRPQYLGEVDKYNLTINDFPSRFERFIFAAIKGLYEQGAQKISAFDIEQYLNTNEAALKVFNDNKGVEYLNDVEQFSNEGNFPYYYTKLKKINLVSELQRQGFDTTEIYIDDVLNPKALEVNERFEQLTIEDIINSLKKKLNGLERDFARAEEVKEWSVDGLVDEVVDGFGRADNLGVRIQGQIYSKIINGAERGALTIRSGSSGLGKTRSAVADACFLAFPYRFNSAINEWEVTGNNEEILFIITEQKPEQILKMILAYLTDINESKFKYGQFTKEEQIRIQQARELLKSDFKHNFKIVQMPNPTIELVKTTIREYGLLNEKLLAVFYDYIFIGPSLLGEFRGFSLRNDEVLLMFATALKDLAVELNVAVFTSTQVNAKTDDGDDIRNEATLAGGRSTINKADNGAIMARPSKDELDLLKKVTSSLTVEPNLVTDIFKVRSGAWTQVRIWSYWDAGTMRRDDLFLTDARLNPIQNFFDEPDIYIGDWDGQPQFFERIAQLNKELDND